MTAAQIANTRGRLGLSFIEVQQSNGDLRVIECGALAVSGGWNPNVHLTCHQRGRPVWNEALATFLPRDHLPIGMTFAGAANGAM